MKKTLVLGASSNPERYSYLAVQRLQTYGHPVIAMGAKPGMIGSVPIATEATEIIDLDTITLYLNPLRQQSYYSFIVGLQPKRIIFNPGTENPELAELAENQGIQVIEACTLVMLASGQY